MTGCESKSLMVGVKNKLHLGIQSQFCDTLGVTNRLNKILIMWKGNSFGFKLNINHSLSLSFSLINYHAFFAYCLLFCEH